MTNTSQTKSLALQDVAIIRPIIIFLLVVLHSFTIYGGSTSWILPEGIRPIPVYSWMVKLISGFRIETIAFVAGYVFAYQSFVLGRKYPFGPFLWKKFKRLIIPCLVFSTIYYFCFNFNPDSFRVGNFVLQLFSGVGHLWFLPMLFWCFVLIWLIDTKQIISWWLFALLAVLSMIPIPTQVLGLGRVFHFLFYCYAGYMVFSKKDWIFNHLLNKKSVVLFWFAYFALVVLYFALIESLVEQFDANFIAKAISSLISHGFKLVYSCIGVMAIYLSVNLYISKRQNFVLPRHIVAASSLCYGVYVFHQFILEWLYYYLPLPEWLGSYALPWVACTITLAVSILFSSLLIKTKVGKFLIG